MTRVVTGLGRNWVWPDADTECIRVVFDWMPDLHRTTRYCKQFRTAIQAGGNMGVWPWELSKSFKRVVTAEPDPECFGLMYENLARTNNIEMYQAALMDKSGTCRLNIELTNRGAQWVSRDPFGVVAAMTIDSFYVEDCDLIYLDIEGAELSALKGAVETITASKPVIAIEDKGLSSRFGSAKHEAEKWLAQFGYSVAARFHNDVVLTCGS